MKEKMTFSVLSIQRQAFQAGAEIYHDSHLNDQKYYIFCNTSRLAGTGHWYTGVCTP